MATFLIVYDIFNQKRLRQIRKIAYSYRLEGQKSSIESPLEKEDVKRLVAELSYFSSKEDKINIIRVVGEPLLLGKAKALNMKNNSIILL